MEKRTSEAFGKKIFLLGKDEKSILYWLKEPSWDCGHYWGFGYVETYTNNKQPHLARDIISHQHIDSSLLGENNDKKGGYCYNIFDAKLFLEMTFTEKEGWELSELFRRFYHLRENAKFWEHGTNTIPPEETIPIPKKPELIKEINKKIIPEITARIIEILTP